MSKDIRELIVVGAGPGGYAAAFTAAKLGLKVTLIAMEENPGGVCLYKGCIPSKAFLHAAKIISDARESDAIGIKFKTPDVDINRLRTWKSEVVSKLTGGLKQLCVLKKIEYIKGKAFFKSSSVVELDIKGVKKEELHFKKAIIATGSSPIKLPFIPESPNVIDSTGALDMENVPSSLLVIGGGYIGIELGTVYAELGTKVTVVEMFDTILPGADTDLSGILFKRIKTLFEDIILGAKVTSVKEKKGKGLAVTIKDSNGKETTKDFEKILVSVGRVPNTSGIGLENTNVGIDDKGFIKVDQKRKTTDDNIYAIGDAAGQPMLAHKATHEGIAAAQAIAGAKGAGFDPKAIPAVVFTNPEIAWCGLTEKEAKEKNKKIKVVKFPWLASGRAVTLNRTDGLTKLIVDADTDRILGAGFAGEDCGELIQEAVLAIEMGARAEDLELTIHSHPTLSETIMEAAASLYGRSIHFHSK